ncbi:hypothetical protein E2C01_082308 [Portunus trituberculatus]|uniref:Uncharacterized protein n=1 Tax=Portunus trituberculatus TaxID=210409 RepID=A0A5B7J0H3_PORTR|nr:hypothetical protein [Portunus trituberculatus]
MKCKLSFRISLEHTSDPACVVRLCGAIVPDATERGPDFHKPIHRAHGATTMKARPGKHFR